MLELYQNILTTQNQLYYIEYSDKNEDESQKRELYIEYSNDDITVRNQLNDTVEMTDKDSSLGEIGKKSAVASFMKKANLLYFSALNNRDIQIVEGIYDSESESGQKLLQQAQTNVNKAETENSQFEFFDYEVKDVKTIDAQTYEVEYYQKYRKTTPEIVEYYEASAKETVIEKNGELYISKYAEIFKHSLDTATNSLNDSE